MAEDLHPGVYLEEVAYRAKATPGVPTALTFLVGVLLGAAAAIALGKARRRCLPPTP